MWMLSSTVNPIVSRCIHIAVRWVTLTLLINKSLYKLLIWSLRFGSLMTANYWPVIQTQAQSCIFVFTDLIYFIKICVNTLQHMQVCVHTHTHTHWWAIHNVDSSNPWNIIWHSMYLCLSLIVLFFVSFLAFRFHIFSHLYLVFDFIEFHC